MDQMMKQTSKILGFWFSGLDQPMELLTKTKADGSYVIRKLSRDETRQMEMFKKMSKKEKKLYAMKHMKCLH